MNWLKRCNCTSLEDNFTVPGKAAYIIRQPSTLNSAGNSKELPRLTILPSTVVVLNKFAREIKYVVFFFIVKFISKKPDYLRLGIILGEVILSPTLT
jgi:hypothetical protein